MENPAVWPSHPYPQFRQEHSSQQQYWRTKPVVDLCSMSRSDACLLVLGPTTLGCLQPASSRLKHKSMNFFEPRGPRSRPCGAQRAFRPHISWWSPWLRRFEALLVANIYTQTVLAWPSSVTRPSDLSMRLPSPVWPSQLCICTRRLFTATTVREGS